MQSHFRCFDDHLKLSIVLFVLFRFCSTSFLTPRPTIRVATAYTPFVAAVCRLFQAVALKKTIRELEEKVQDQEEELDDQAGKIQMLEQVSVVCSASQWFQIICMRQEKSSYSMPGEICSLYYSGN